MKENTELCSCGKPASAPHPCPYNVELYDDYDTLCTCCKECTQQCGDDV